MLQSFPVHVAEELDSPLNELDSLLSQVSVQIGLDNQKLEYRLQGIKKARLMMDRLNEAIMILRQKPNGDELMYNVLYHTFISSEQTTIEAVQDKLKISPRHYYRICHQAINIISIRLWAAPEAELDSWLEVLSLLNSF